MSSSPKPPKKIVVKEVTVKEEEIPAIREDDFITTKGIILPKMLKEENCFDAKLLRSQFVISKSNNWVQKFFKNDAYFVIENEGGGDCFFACIRDAFSSIGQQTTNVKLRRKVSAELTNTIFNEYATKYEYYNHESSTITNKINFY